MLVPTRELGVQTVMLAYKLWGGSVNPGVPGLAGNMFAYGGPRGLKVLPAPFPAASRPGSPPAQLVRAHCICSCLGAMI